MQLCSVYKQPFQPYDLTDTQGVCGSNERTHTRAAYSHSKASSTTVNLHYHPPHIQDLKSIKSFLLHDAACLTRWVCACFTLKVCLKGRALPDQPGVDAKASDLPHTLLTCGCDLLFEACSSPGVLHRATEHRPLGQ